MQIRALPPSRLQTQPLTAAPRPLGEPQDRVQLGGRPAEDPLLTGVPFAASGAEEIKEILGFPLTHEGLSNLYGSCLSGSQCFVTDIETRSSRLEYRVSWRDLEGRELAHATAHVQKHPDGSLELHRSNVFVVPECRGQALNVKVMAQEIELLRRASSHPDSRITLEAGSARVEGQPQRLGAYTWATFGFDFADRYPQGKSRLASYNCDCSWREDSQPDAELMQQQFHVFVKNRFGEGELAETLLKAADKLEHPWQLARLAIPGHKLEVSVGDDKVACEIGKAFMTSEFCSNWSGVFRVNDPDFEGRPVAEATFNKQLGLAGARLEQERKQIEDQLENDPEAALQQLAIRGQASWIERLERLPLRRPDLRGKVEEVIDRIRCVGLLKRLRQRQWSESTQAVIREQRDRMDRGWPGYVCKLGVGVGDRSWTGRLKTWANRWFGVGEDPG